MELTKKQKKALIKCIDHEIQDHWGTHNKICPQCLCRYGHNLVYCAKCGHKNIDFKDIPVKITYRDWILKATDEEEKQKRAVAVLWPTNWNRKPWPEKEKIGKEIIKIVGA